jgi:hypothetical protein
MAPVKTPQMTRDQAIEQLQKIVDAGPRSNHPTDKLVFTLAQIQLLLLEGLGQSTEPVKP